MTPADTDINAAGAPLDDVPAAPQAPASEGSVAEPATEVAPGRVEEAATPSASQVAEVAPEVPEPAAEAPSAPTPPEGPIAPPSPEVPAAPPSPAEPVEAPAEAPAEVPAPDAPTAPPAPELDPAAAEGRAGDTAVMDPAAAERRGGAIDPAPPEGAAEVVEPTPPAAVGGDAAMDPMDPPVAPEAEGSAPSADRGRAGAARPSRRSRQADRRKALEEQSRALASELGRDPDRKVIERAILSAGGPDAVREFLATPQESREGKPLGWRIACLREARRHDAGGRAEGGWVTLSAVPVRHIRHALDRAVDADGRIMFRDEPEPARGGRGGSRGRGDRPGGRGQRGSGDDRATAERFLEGGVASFGGDDAPKRNPFAALSGLLDSGERD